MNAERQSEESHDDVEPQQRIAEALVDSGQTAAAAESLTGGSISATLSAVEGASDWFRGGIIAYAPEVKFDVLGVDRGPVITADTASQMAVGVAKLLGADYAVATTGVGGPGPQEGKPQGTVYVAVAVGTSAEVAEYRFDGDPSAVVEQATAQALADLAAAIIG